MDNEAFEAEHTKENIEGNIEEEENKEKHLPAITYNDETTSTDNFIAKKDNTESTEKQGRITNKLLSYLKEQNVSHVSSETIIKSSLKSTTGYYTNSEESVKETIHESTKNGVRIKNLKEEKKNPIKTEIKFEVIDVNERITDSNVFGGLEAQQNDEPENGELQLHDKRNKKKQKANSQQMKFDKDRKDGNDVILEQNDFVENSENDIFDRQENEEVYGKEKHSYNIPSLNLPNDSPKIKKTKGKRKETTNMYNRNQESTVTLNTFDVDGNRVYRSGVDEITLQREQARYDHFRSKSKDEEGEYNDVRLSQRNHKRRGNCIDLFVFDDLYVRRNWDGRIKVVQCISSLLAAVILPSSYQYYYTRYIFHRFVAITCFICTAIDLFLHLCSIWVHIPKWIKSSVVLMILCFIGSMSILASSCLVIVIADINPDEQQSLASSLCGLICMIFFGIDTTLQFFRYRAQLPLQ